MAADPRVHIGVAAMVFNRGMLAMLQRAPDASHGQGMWSVPGGWVDFGEDPFDSAVREVYEEVGLNVYNPVFSAYVTNTYPEESLHVICHFYHCTYREDTSGALQNMEPDKHSKVAWVTRARVREMLDEGLLFAPLADYINMRGVWAR